MKIEIIPAYERKDEFLRLVREYIHWLMQYGAEVSQVLAAQHISSEMIDIEQKYALPWGRMYLALVDACAAGCGALTKNDTAHCEIKRLYVQPAFRKLGIGSLIVAQIMADARAIGYKYMRLDTFPFMKKALKLYEQQGFYYIERYNNNMAKSAIFMQANLLTS